MGNWFVTDEKPNIGTGTMTLEECIAFGSEYVWSDDGLCLTFEANQEAEKIKCETNGGYWEETWNEGFCTELWLALSQKSHGSGEAVADEKNNSVMGGYGAASLMAAGVICLALGYNQCAKKIKGADTDDEYYRFGK